MDSSVKFLSYGLSLVLSMALVGCGTGKDEADGTGGSAGTSSAAGGSSTTAGSSGSSSGGSAGSTTTMSTLTRLYTFDNDTQDFGPNNTASADPMYTNLSDPTNAVDHAAKVGWTGTLDYDDAATAKGCLMLSAIFTGWNQQLSAEASGPADKDGAPIDLTNKTLRAQVYLKEGLSPFTTSDAPGGVVFYIKSGSDYAWGQAPWTNLQNYGSWTSVKFNTDNPDSGSAKSWDPSNPIQIGFQVSSGGGNMHSAEEFGDPLPTSVCIDNITVQDN